MKMDWMAQTFRIIWVTFNGSSRSHSQMNYLDVILAFNVFVGWHLINRWISKVNHMLSQQYSTIFKVSYFLRLL